ncbi:MAG: AAA family ATPase [Dehalococcoidia bacterium]|nr:AAA family ATPase [Dehalococcoidia bacterium]
MDSSPEMQSDLPGLIAALSLAETYPEKPASVEFIQTQMSCIFLTPDFAYKIKKPVNLGYVDYTTLEKRRYFCEQEVELNRRLCPDSYIGVLPITFDGGRYALNGSGETVEYCVKMHRLPNYRLLDRLLEQRAVTPDMMDEVALKISAFHAGAETSEEIAAYGSPEVVTRNTEENFSQTDIYVGRCITQKQFERISSFTRAFIHDNREIFERRIRERRTRDCHGDLHAQHVCFCDDDVHIFDCIEFNQRFRYCDIISEIAFLAMDLDHAGRADLGHRFIQSYAKHSHDPDIAALLTFYKCYRAYVRGKVAGFKLDDPLVSQPEKEASAAIAKGYFDLALSYTRQRPVLVIMTGLTGSGKTTIASALAGRLGAIHASSDVTRKQLAGIPETEHRFDEKDGGIYTPEFTRRTYDAILKQASEALRDGGNAILDAAFLRQKERNEAVTMAKELGVDWRILECRLSPELTQKRLLERLAQPSASDGRWEIYQRQTGWFEPVPDTSTQHYLLIDTSLPIEQNISGVLDWMD